MQAEVTKPLVTDEQIAKFHEFGYLVVEDAIPCDKVEQLLGVIDRMKGELETSGQRKEVFGLDIGRLLIKMTRFSICSSARRPFHWRCAFSTISTSNS